MKDYYSILELSKDASENDIKRAYKKAALKYHPDKGGDPEKFKEISEAYQILQDPNKKAMYDRGEDPLAGPQQSQNNPFDHNSFFQNFFNQAMGGMGGMGSVKRSNHQHQISIDLRDVHTGLEKNMKINIKKTCFDCKKECPHCHGRGMIFIRHGPLQMQQSCHACNTSGVIDHLNSNCSNCKGAGSISEDQICRIQIPKGVANGSVITLGGLGEQPRKRGELPGDLLFHIHIKPHPFFNRDKDDIVYNVSITFKESIVGKNIVVPHFDGDIPIYTGNFGIINPNRAYRLKERGLAGKGDLVLLFNIEYPEKKLDEEVLDQFRKIIF